MSIRGANARLGGSIRDGTFLLNQKVVQLKRTLEVRFLKKHLLFTCRNWDKEILRNLCKSQWVCDCPRQVVLNVLSGECFLEDAQGQNYYNNNTNVFFILSLLSILWSFTKTTCCVISQQIECKADMKIQLSPIRPDIKGTCNHVKQCTPQTKFYCSGKI